MSEPYKNPESNQVEPIRIGVILPGILQSLREEKIPDMSPGRALATKLRYFAQFAEVVIEDITSAEIEGRPTTHLDQELRDTNTQIHEIKQGFMPGQETRPQ